MQRTLTPATTLDNLRKEAKRWLKALRENNAKAREHFQHAYPNGPSQPVLRDVQHALARVYGQNDWKGLKKAVQESAARSAATRDAPAQPVARFLEYACPDHHVRSLPAHRMARHAAVRLLEEHPGIARDSIYAAAVCGELDEVERLLREQPQLANAKRETTGADRSGGGGSYDFLGDPGAKNWEPLLFLCFTRLPLAKANDNAVAMARLLLDHGADPNAYFMAGGSRYSPLAGVIGEGEEDRPAHPRRDELARLLLERGAEPFDGQVIYNIHFHGKVLWWLKLMYEFSVKAGRLADWRDPEWNMIGQGGYGTGAWWHLRIAVEKNDIELAEWCLANGANPNAAPGRDPRQPKFGLYENAVRAGHVELAEILARHGAERRDIVLDDEEQFVTACLRLDRDEASRLVRLHPEFLQSPKALFAAARGDSADAAAFLLELGVPIEIEDAKKQRPLHVAAANDAVHVAALLIERGAEIDPYEQNYGNTPLDFAVYHDHSRMIELLRPHSRDVWNLAFIGDVDRLRDVLLAEPHLAKVSWEATPLFWLPEDEGKAVEIVRLFLKHGADPNFHRKNDGATAADVARRRGMNRVGALLDGPGNPRTAEDYQRAANDFVAAYEGDAAALERLNQHYDRTFSNEDLRAEIWRRVYAFRQRSSRVPKNYLQLDEAQTIVAQDAGFGNWAALLEASTTGAPPSVEAFEVDAKENAVAPRRRMNGREWDELIGVVKERGITAVHANGMMTDAMLSRIAEIDHVTTLNLGGSRELTDDGLLHLSRMPQLEHLNLSEYPGGKLTDRGLAALRHLSNLRTFEMTWQAGVSDAGVANLRFCDRLEQVNLMGSPTGDGAIEALQGKPNLRRFSSGRLVTDAGLPFLQNFPQLKQWQGGEIKSGDKEALANATRLLIDGPFTNLGLASLAGLEGIFELDLFWHVSGITSEGFAHLVHLPNLGALGCDGELSNDAAMRHIAAIPRLRKLRAQESAATDDGFVALSRSSSLESFWGRECAGFGNRAFLAFSKMPALRGMGVSLKNVDDEALSALPLFPALRELTPIGVKDDGFRHVGRCLGLERLTCMYCRETTDIATQHIAGLAINYYYAGLTQITDRSLEILGGMQSLEQIELYECKGVTDAGLRFLASLPRLREVHLDGLPGVTLEGTRAIPGSVRVRYST